MNSRSGWVFRVLTVLTIGGVMTFALSVALDDHRLGVLSWVPVPVVSLLCTYLFRQVRLAQDAPPGLRRYWLLGFAAMVLFSLAATLWLLDALGVGLPLVPAAIGIMVVAAVMMIAGQVGLPLGDGSRTSGVTMTLDAGTLMAAGGLLVFHFAVLPLLQSGQVTIGTAAAAIVLMTTGLGAVHTGARVAMSGVLTMSWRSASAIGVGGMIGGIGSAISLILPVDLPANTLPFVLPLSMFALALSVRFHMIDSATTEAAAPRRGYSLLPYAAVAVVFAMLVSTASTHASDHPVVIGVAVVSVVLVIFRQLIAFRQNDSLLQHLGLQEKQFRALVQNSTDMVCIIDPDRNLRYVSPAARRVLGLEPAEMRDAGLLGQVHPGDQQRASAQLEAVFGEPGRADVVEMRALHADGSYRWLEVTMQNRLHEPGINGVITNARDVTETRDVQDRLSHEATHDALTGLPNRVLFGRRLEAATERSGDGGGFSIVLVDLDDFKIVNDTLGHAVGDSLLVHVAQRMTAAVRPADTVARLGGDEFAILFDGLGGTDVGGVLTRLATTLLDPAVIDGELLSVKASFGVVEGRPGDDTDHLMRRADIAMYEAKERGEGGHQIYEPGMQARGAERARIAEELASAIHDGQLVLHFQPEVSLPDGEIVGVEALVRWQHPERGLLGPGAFVEAAEQTGLIVSLGRWVLHAAIKQAVAWSSGTGRPIPVSVNISARQLRDPGFATEVAAALRDHDLAPRLLTLEITEAAAVGGDEAQQNLGSLRDIGVRLSLDDFGTGGSTLSLLATCPVDEIKLDRSFTPPPGTEAIATAVLQLARAFNIIAVAKGAETEEQVQRLTALGYTRAQGFYFARPVPAEQLFEMLRHLAGTAVADSSGV